MGATLHRDEWLAHLRAIAEALPRDGDPVKLCLIGSAACLLDFMPGRASHDLDVWMPASDFDENELRSAVEAAGLLFDPQTLETGKPYVQLVRPGPTQAGKFDPVFWTRMGRLHIYLPPWPNFIASKLARGEPRDVEDVIFVAGKHHVDVRDIEQCAQDFEQPARGQVLENLVYLRIIEP